MKKFFCVFGSTSGIGLEFVKKNIKRNNIYCIGQNFAELDKFVEKNKCKKNYIKIKTNLSKNNSFSIYKKIKNKLDLILISSGVHIRNNISHFEEKYYHNTLNVNLINPVKILAKLYSLDKINTKANIVFIGSINGTEVYVPGSLSYGMSKSALVAACKYFAAEMIRDKIKVNIISPGMVKTPLIKKNEHLSLKFIKNDKKKYILSKDYLSINSIINTINFLISNRQKNITGQNIVIDSGYTLYK
jgi:NAD(P)-dependent dehydrogenase (short-subunit alcohol dehydrogenase family)